MGQRDHYPEPTAAPCNECPWRREAVSGHLGPYTAHDWVKIAHSDSPIACHKTIVPVELLEGVGSWDHPKIRQCRGAAIFRANVQKEPKHPEIVAGPPDKVIVFGENNEFVVHHGEPEMTIHDMYRPLSTETWGEHDFDLREGKVID